MKILLHIGQGKTGTTALQQSLHASADHLRARSIAYPHFGGRAIAHHLLLPLCGDPRKLPLWSLEDAGGPEEAVRKAHAAWQATCDDLRSNPPELLVLSSELLLTLTDRHEKTRLAEILRELSSDIVPIVYVRHPVEFYRSLVQEALKATSAPRPPIDRRLRETLTDIEDVFGTSPSLVAYDRATLVQGDIVADFASRFLSPRIDPQDLPRRHANRGLSAEALVLMAQLRREWGDSIVEARRVASLKPHLEAFDRDDPPARPLTLLPDVADAALRSATGYRWLAETGRLRIPDLDINRIDGAPVPDWMLSAPSETMFSHDPDRLARLRGLIDRIVANSKPTATARPRLQDRLVRFLNRKLEAIGQRPTATAAAGSGAAKSDPATNGPNEA